MKLLYILFLSLLPSIVWSQNTKSNDRKKYFTTTLSLGITTETTGNYYHNAYLDEEVEEGSYLLGIRFSGGIFVHPYISVGVGMGIEENIGYLEKVTCPIFADLRIYTNTDEDMYSDLFLYCNYGKLMRFGNFSTHGDFFEVGIGYSSISLGYNYRKITNNGDTFGLNTMIASVVLTF